MKYFMSDKEIESIRALLKKTADSIPELPMDKIVFFDRFHFPEKDIFRETGALSTLLEGIYNQKTVQLKYYAMNKSVIEGEFKPIVLEFSKRDNRFQAYLRSCENDRIYVVNVSQIAAVDVTENDFNYEDAEEALLSFRNENMTSVEVEFYNVRNTADRILTEFSPWRKRCTYDKETQRYRLTIFYHKYDEIELAVRLLGYGAVIRFVDQEHPIRKELEKRVNTQMELLRKGISAKRKVGDSR